MLKGIQFFVTLFLTHALTGLQSVLLVLVCNYTPAASTVYLLLLVYSLIFSGLLLAYPRDGIKVEISDSTEGGLQDEITSKSRRPALTDLSVFGLSFEALMSISFHGSDGYTYIPGHSQTGDDVLSFFSLSACRQTRDITLLAAGCFVLYLLVVGRTCCSYK
eukprot:scaffold2437_cov395-Prasinococcus_capsulatus_cf.AAC.9